MLYQFLQFTENNISRDAILDAALKPRWGV